MTVLSARARVAAAAVALTLAGCAGPGEQGTAAADPAPRVTGSTAASQVEVIKGFGEPGATGSPAPEAVGRAWNEALAFAGKHGDKLGHPYIDGGDTLVITAVDEQSLDLARQAVRSGEISKVSTDYRVVSQSADALGRIANEVRTLPDSEVPGASTITMISIQEERNRVLITTTEVSPEMLEALAARYGTDAIAVRHAPGSGLRNLLPE